MSDRTRRPSRGGLPPVQIREKYVVEQAPGFDGVPCFTAWIRNELVRVPEGWQRSDFDMVDGRPGWSIQIYDTTPRSDTPVHLKDLAETLHRETREKREESERTGRDRIDVWGMPLAPDASEEERIAACRAHSMAVIASRVSSQDSDFKIPQLYPWRRRQRAILIITRPVVDWDNHDDSFLPVFWDDDGEEGCRDLTARVSHSARANLGVALQAFRAGI